MIRVLVADDEPDTCLLLRLQLGLLGDVEVVGTAIDGDEAILLCRQLHPDALVLDLLMPGATALDAIAALREEQPTLGIVAYTGVAGDEARQTMDRHGVPMVLKDGDIGPLAKAIRAVSLAHP